MREKPQNPYNRLKDRMAQRFLEIIYPRKKIMWNYPKNRLHEGWPLRDLWERTAAAKQIGYEVVLTAEEDGLRVTYVNARPDSIPAELS